MVKMEKELRDRCIEFMKRIERSKSHGVWHSLDVLKYSLILQERYEGNRKVLIVASILHDASRHIGSHGKKQGEESLRIVDQFLNELVIDKMINEKEKALIREAIASHSLKDSSIDLSLESKILSDADSLSGFGVKGLIRISMYAGERGLGLEYVKKKFCNDMFERFNNLFFDESRLIAKGLLREVKEIKKRFCSNGLINEF